MYGFATLADALAAYIARMASYGVALRSGDCQAGTAGDRAWTPGDGPDEGGDLPYRIGCFLDENGTANVRLTCGDPETGVVGPIRYIGVLGAARGPHGAQRVGGALPGGSRGFCPITARHLLQRRVAGSRTSRPDSIAPDSIPVAITASEPEPHADRDPLEEPDLPGEER